MNILWGALALVLVVEGLGPMLFPKQWRQMVTELSQQPDSQLRRIGGCLVVIGGVLAYHLLA
ncbi:DUF2065 domain-containing protein [Salinivibrio sp. ES.052]|uniref:DUF2065 domain-containing protein n=1 Tax=Salinivibrio sp. ES.052 TaxID=1882823 RepID=UPI0009276E5E|nr:DUF2065 domain-containing protein [Salinivibrio sp. ES.052]SIO26212.1 hypothetical protein SAMN05444724_2482 [Salinivibrio sp. ES.052]